MKKSVVILLSFCFSCLFAQTTSTSNSKPQTLEFEVNGITFEMVFVQGGKFVMGRTINEDYDVFQDESPVHSVTIFDFYIGKTEVTQELYKAVMGENPSNFRAYKNPVDNVSWDDAQEFIRRLNSLTGKNFRLPTEAEWEYAARGGVKSKNYKYSGSNKIEQVAWFENNTRDAKHHRRAGVLLPNELGIHDMSGNVWEWCNDWYDDYSKDPQKNPMGPFFGDFRVLRGGAYIGVPQSCRATNRSSDLPTKKSIYNGFRLAIYL